MRVVCGYKARHCILTIGPDDYVCTFTHLRKSIGYGNADIGAAHHGKVVEIVSEYDHSVGP